ncbi:translationally-controlled tumor protein homolog [Paramacrobiotus metropolitanus]|uniref:translationally-controlled tumor protein homolog n=1 Tax=Paramacrobiotus metropolitanus TaxID=2943436 RepID=UPI002445A9E2|nr:translationally-controlled tumor protein homolog [Paramacrobiotus metropolitanus]
MIIYKDYVTGDELFTDSYKMKLVDGVIYEVEGKYIQRKVGDVVLAGANPSQEEQEEESEEGTESGIDVVLNQRLVEAKFYENKEDYTKYIKAYMKSLMKRVEETKPAELDAFKKGAQEAVKSLLGRHGNMQFFMGESMDSDKGMVIPVEYKDTPTGQVPTLYFFKHGLVEEKV